MSAHIVDLKAQHGRALAKADEILAAAERGRRHLTANESQTVKSCTEQATELKSEIDRVESVQRFKNLRAENPAPDSLSIGTGPRSERLIPKTLSAEYAAAFYRGVHKIDGRENDPSLLAALGEGTGSLGGFAVPSLTADDQYVPLAPPDLTIRSLAKKIVTTADLRIPGTTTLPTAAVKTEGGAFAVTSPSVGQFTISAYLVGAQIDASMEIFQDAPIFMAAVGDDGALAVQENEEALYLSGSGSGQPQGMLGNVGTGVTGEVADGSGNLLSVAATFDVLTTLKDKYHRNASWLMSRATGIELRKAQAQTNLFTPVFTRDSDGQERLHGYPVAYSSAMPAIAAGATPVLFGDFNSGYLIADRQSSAIFLKVVDQDTSKAILGLIPLLFYRRTDGRVRRSEAIQGITLHT